jgi:hypothetical protein
MRSSRRLALFLVTTLAVACGEANPLSPDGDIVIQPIPIDSVDVTVGPNPPARVFARVRGALGSGCDFLHSIEQRRQGATVTIDIRRSGVTEGVCTTIFKGFDQELALPESFAPGEYTLRVNAFTRTFRVE